MLCGLKNSPEITLECGLIRASIQSYARGDANLDGQNTRMDRVDQCVGVWVGGWVGTLKPTHGGHAREIGGNLARIQAHELPPRLSPVTGHLST